MRGSIDLLNVIIGDMKFRDYFQVRDWLESF